MKKTSLFFISLIVAVIIAYNKPHPTRINRIVASQKTWNTFEKKAGDKIVQYITPSAELEKHHLDSNMDRKIASINPSTQSSIFSLREDRVLIGEDFEKYRDESIDLSMQNSVNPNWKELLGKDLLRFQKEDTKIIIKDELSLIKVKDSQGLYLEQVIITYLLKDGTQNSFHALVNSETGFVIDTWDRTIHEQYQKAHLKLVPSGTSNIMGK